MDMLAWSDGPIGEFADAAVAESLFPFHDELGLGLTWKRYEGSSQTDTLRLTPPFPGGRSNLAVDASVLPRAALCESTWGLVCGKLERGSKATGVIDLRVGVHVRFYVARGLNRSFPIGKHDSRDGFLTWADEYVLATGDKCFRLETIAGDLWIKNAGGTPLENQLSERQLPTFVAHRVIHLPHFYHSREIRSPMSISEPWSGLQTTDNDGRVWIIRDSPLRFTAACELHVAGRYNVKLGTRERIVLQPPYQCVWAKDGLVGQMPSFTAS